jgi:hypothetical protein
MYPDLALAVSNRPSLDTNKGQCKPRLQAKYQPRIAAAAPATLPPELKDLAPPRNGGDGEAGLDGEAMLDETGTEDEEPTGVEDGIIGVDVGRVTMGPEGLTGPYVGVAFPPVAGILVLVEPRPTGGTEIGTPTLEHSVTTTLETAVESLVWMTIWSICMPNSTG